MPRVLLMRLEAPLVAFGDMQVDAHGPVSDLPAASMLTGLFANALGWRRTDRAAQQRLQDRLVHAARRDRSAGRFVEFQTARLGKADRAWTTRGRIEERAGGATTYDSPHLRYRAHDADLCVHVALYLAPADEAPDLDTLAAALDEPFRPLFIGRKPCLPATRLLAGLVEADNLLAALTGEPLAPPRGRADAPVLIELPGVETPPEGFRPVHRAERRDFTAGVHTGDTVRWTGTLPRAAFPVGQEAS